MTKLRLASEFVCTLVTARLLLMGSGSSLYAGSSSSSYRFGQAARDNGDDNSSYEGGERVSRKQQRTLEWIGKTLEMPPKPFSLDNYFQSHTVVGTGMLGRVRLVQHRKTKKFYALKSLKKKDIVARKMLQQLEAERAALLALTKLHHPFMARYFGSLQTSYHVHFLVEYVPGGELFRRLHQVGGRFHNDEAKFYAAELLLFLEFCHANGFMYRDLKPENVMLDGAGHIKVIDFGFVKKIASADDRTSTTVGTSQYLAPEQLTNMQEKRSYTKAVDWWAWACVVYEMVNGHTPFFRRKDDSPFELYTRIVKGQVSWPSRMNQSLKDLLRKMLVPDPAKRLSDAEEIKQHPWFAQVDWLEVMQCELQPPHTPALRVEGDYSNFDAYPISAEETQSPMTTYANEFRNF